MYYPSRRSDVIHPLFNPVLKDFDKKSEFNFFERRVDDLVALTFENVPYNMNFRWSNEWWKKVGPKYGINGEGHEFQIPPQHLVGVHLKGLTKKEKENIVELKDDDKH